MRNLLIFHIALLLIGDFLLFLLFLYTQSVDGRYMGIGLVNLVLGIVQTITFIVMLFSRKNYNVFFFIYLLMTIGFSIYWIGGLENYNEEYFRGAMITALFLAHLFVSMLFLTTRLRAKAINQQ